MPTSKKIIGVTGMLCLVTLLASVLLTLHAHGRLRQWWPSPIGRSWHGAALALFLFSLAWFAASSFSYLRKNVVPSLMPRRNAYWQWLISELFFLPTPVVAGVTVLRDPGSAGDPRVPPGSRSTVTPATKSATMFCCLGLFALGCVLIFPLMDRHYDYSFEADADANVHITRMLARALHRGSTSGLERPGSYPPYFDGLFFTYAATSLCLHAVEGDAPGFDLNGNCLYIRSVRYTSALMLVLSGVLCFLTLRTLNVGVIIALPLSALPYLSPHSLQTDFLRSDHVILFAILLVTWLTLRLLDHPASVPTSLAWGAAVALLMNAKFTTFTTLLPTFVFILGLPLARKAQFYPRIRWALLSFAVLSSVFLVRYMLHFPGIWSILRARSAELGVWIRVMSCQPLWGYNYDQFLENGYGGWFLLLALATLLFVTVQTMCGREKKAAYILTSLAMFSAVGLMQPKALRWGIHFPPFYFMIIGLGLTGAQTLADGWFRGGRLMRVLLSLACLALLFAPARNLWAGYQRQLRAAEQRDEAILVTRLEPREWFKAFVPAGSKVATFGHCWADPPIYDLQYAMDVSLLRFPYLDDEKLAAFAPPSEDGRDGGLDVMVLNNLQKDGMFRHLSRPGFKKQKQLWERYFAELYAKHTVLRFSHSQGCHGVSTEDVVILSDRIARRFAEQPGRFARFILVGPSPMP